MRNILLALTGLIALCLAFHLDPEGVSAEEVVQKWVFKTGGNVAASPAIGADGMIFVGSNDGNLYALYPDGKLKWKFSTKGAIHSHPAIGSDGTIYIGSWDHNLYAINPDGSLKWSYPTGGQINASPILGSDGTIYVGSWDHNLYAINPKGALKWKFPTKGEIFSTPAIGPDGTLYIGCWGHFIYAIKEGKARPLGFKKPEPEKKRKPKPSKKAAGLTVIKAVKVETTPGGEDRVFIFVHPFNRPRYAVLNGDKPRLVCDFFNTRLGSGIGRPIKVQGKFLRQIRMAFHRGANPRVRIVLDIAPNQNYTAKQAVLENQNIYSIVIGPK